MAINESEKKSIMEYKTDRWYNTIILVTQYQFRILLLLDEVILMTNAYSCDDANQESLHGMSRCPPVVHGLVFF